MTGEVIIGEASEVDEQPTTPQEIAIRPEAHLSVTPQVEASELVKRLAVIAEAMNTAMVKDVDYGIIPGTDKPALFKPGSEKLAVLFQLDVQIENRKTWGEKGHLTVESIAQVFHAPTGTRLGSGEGMCTTYEKKYRYRGGTKTCPTCGAATIFRSRYAPREGDYQGASPQDDPGWFCWTSKGGCGANFAFKDDRIDVTEKAENPDLADTWNTVVKMAAKRARVDAILNVTGASALFTQDVEDAQDAPAEPPPAAAAATTTATTTTAPQPAGGAPTPTVAEGAPANPATKPYNLGGYDTHNIDKIKPLLPQLSDDQLAYVEWYERYAIPAGQSAPKNRKGVLDAIGQEHRERARARLVQEEEARKAQEDAEPTPTEGEVALAAAEATNGTGAAIEAEAAEAEAIPFGEDEQPELHTQPWEWTPLDERPPTKAEFDAAVILAENAGTQEERDDARVLIDAYQEAQETTPQFVAPATARPSLMRVVKGMGILVERGVESWAEPKVIESAIASFSRPGLTSLEQLTDAELDSIFTFMPDDVQAEARGEGGAA